MTTIARLLAFLLTVRAYRASRGAPPKTRPASRPRGAPTRPSSTEPSTPSLEEPIPPQRAGDAGPDSPLELDQGDWKVTLKRTLKEIKDDRIPFAAAAMAYYFFLAIFPAFIAIIGVMGLIEADTSGLIGSINSAMPGKAGEVLTDALANAENPGEGAQLVAAVVGIALALWSASSGFAALQTGLNVAYDVGSDRKFVGKRLVGLMLLGATLVLGGVPSPLFTFGESAIFSVLGWALTIVAVMVLFSLYYYLGPNRPKPSWQWVSVGGVVGAIVWIAASLVFGLYAEGFSNYGKTYGSLAGVIVLIFWLYLSSMAVLLGGELNAELERRGAESGGRGR